MARVLRVLGRFLLIVIGYPLALALGLVVLVLVALQIPPLRSFAVQKGLDYANENLLGGYRVEVKGVDRLDPWGLNVRGIRVHDEQEREIVAVRWVLVRLNPYALVGNTLALTKVEIDDVRAHLYPSEPQPEEPEEPPSEPSSFTIRADDVRVRGVAVETEWSGRRLHAVVGTLRAAGRWGPEPALALRELTARATADDDLLLRLRTTEGTFTAEQGGRVELEGQLVEAPLSLTAELPALARMEPWPLRRAKLTLSGVTRETLATLGIPDGAELNRRVDLSLEAEASGQRLEAELQLKAGPARVHLHARVDDAAYEADLRLSELRLAELAGILPELKVEGTLSARATPPEGLPQRVTLRWKNIELDDSAIPDGMLRAALPLPIVRLEELTLAGFEDALDLRGEYHTEAGRGSGELSLRRFQLEAIAYLRAMGLAGMLDGDLAASFSSTQLNGEGKLALRDFRHPSARLAELDLTLGVHGSTSAPVGRISLQANRLAVDALVIDQLTAEAEATQDEITGRLQVRGPNTLLKAELGGQRTDDGELRAQAIGRGRVQKRDLRFDLRNLLYGEGGVTVQELSLYSGRQALRLSGNLDSQDRVRAEVRLRNVDVGEWAELAGAEDVAGTLDGTLQLGGTTSLPRVESKLQLTGARYKSELPLNASLALSGDLETRRAEVKLSAYSDEELGARLTASVALPRKPSDLAEAAQYARVDAELTAWMPIEQISALAGDQLAGLAGMFEAHVTASGTLDDPKLDADVTAAMKLPEQEGEPVEAVRLTAKVTQEEAKASIWAKDEAGELLTLDGFVAWPGGSPRAALEQPERWQNARFELETELQSRRLDSMQGAFAYFSKLYALSLPIRAAGRVSLAGDEGKLDGAARLSLVVYGDKLDGRCRLGAESAVDLDARLKRDTMEMDIAARTEGGGAIEGKVETKLALNALTSEAPVVGPAKLTLNGRDVAIHELPGLCNLAGGSASFELTAAGLGQQRPTMELDAKVVDLHAPEMPPMSFDARARVGGERAMLTTQILSEGRAIGSIAAAVPLSYPDGVTPTVMPNAPLEGHVRFRELALANVLSFTEALGRTSGTASADIALSGKVADPYPSGYLEFEDVNVSIAALAQPLRDMDGRIEVKGRSIKIPKLSVRDRDGKIELEGYLTLRQDLTGEGGVYVEADQFPLRQQGTIIGELTTRARLDVTIPEDLKAKAQLKILDGSMWLTGERGKAVQSLDPHPDVRFADEKVAYESTPTEEKAEGQSFGLGSLRMRSEQALWLNHKDFAIQVGVDLMLQQEEDGPTLNGEATLVRGELQLLGKPFKLQRGAIRFAGPMPPNPELDIKAVFTPPRGEKLIVQVSGRASAPELDFSGAATNAGEALLVLQGRAPATGSTQGAEAQAANSMAGIAADMTAGLLIMTARREFGDWVPMISVDTGRQGQPASARAAFDASKLIPDWLDGFARSAYVEGIVGQSAQSGRGVGVGVRLEVALPRDFVTSFGYGPSPGGWSTDVAWSP